MDCSLNFACSAACGIACKRGELQQDPLARKREVRRLRASAATCALRCIFQLSCTLNVHHFMATTCHCSKAASRLQAPAASAIARGSAQQTHLYRADAMLPTCSLATNAGRVQQARRHLSAFGNGLHLAQSLAVLAGVQVQLLQPCCSLPARVHALPCMLTGPCLMLLHSWALFSEL